MLGELAAMALVVARAHAAAAVAAANAVEVILADECWQPETGRARALAGSRDAAEAFQKVSRALRLTLMLEKATADFVRDLRLGIEKKVVAATPRNICEIRREDVSSDSVHERRADRRSDAAAERLVDIERTDVLPRLAFRETVDRICADLGADVDWNAWKIAPPEPAAEIPDASPDWSEAFVRHPSRGCGLPDAADREAALPP